MQDPVKAYQCRHIFADGHRCGSKSLRGEHFCYYHHTTRKPTPRTRPENPAEAAFDLPFPEDRAAIQLSIGEILRRIARNEIDPRRAGLLLYGLQIASCNLPKPAPVDPRDEPDIPEEIEIHSEYGPIAPVSEYTIPEEHLSFAGRLLRELGEHPDYPPIPTLQACEDSGPVAPGRNHNYVYATAPIHRQHSQPDRPPTPTASTVAACRSTIGEVFIEKSIATAFQNIRLLFTVNSFNKVRLGSSPLRLDALSIMPRKSLFPKAPGKSVRSPPSLVV